MTPVGQESQADGLHWGESQVIRESQPVDSHTRIVCIINVIRCTEKRNGIKPMEIESRQKSAEMDFIVVFIVWEPRPSLF